MTLEELKVIPELSSLLVLDEDDEESESLCAPDRALHVAEADCTIRIFDLLHRDEYRPIAAVRFHDAGRHAVRVYFERIDSE